MSQKSDVTTTIVDLSAVLIFVGLGWVNGSPWWLAVAAGWGLLTIRQAKLTVRAARYRHAPLPSNDHFPTGREQ